MPEPIGFQANVSKAICKQTERNRWECTFEDQRGEEIGSMNADNFNMFDAKSGASKAHTIDGAVEFKYPGQVDCKKRDINGMTNIYCNPEE